MLTFIILYVIITVDVEKNAPKKEKERKQMGTQKKYVCKYCRAVRVVSSTTYPQKTKCFQAPGGYHVWAKVDLR